MKRLICLVSALALSVVSFADNAPQQKAPGSKGVLFTSTIHSTGYSYGGTRWWGGRKITQTPEGTLYTCYTSDENGGSTSRNMLFSKSTDGGKTWEKIGDAKTILSNTYRAYHGALAYDAAGKILHATWYAKLNGGSKYRTWYASYTEGSGWSTPIEMSKNIDTGADTQNPAIAVGPQSDDVIVTWTTNDGSAIKKAWYSRKVNGSWTTPVDASGGAVVFNSLAVTIDPVTGKGIIAWVSKPSNGTAANSGYAAEIAPNGTNLGKSNILSSMNFDAVCPVYNNLGDLFFVYNVSSPDGGEITNFRWYAHEDAKQRGPLPFNGSVLQSIFGEADGTYPLGTKSPSVGFDQDNNLIVIAEGVLKDDNNKRGWSTYWTMARADNTSDLDSKYKQDAWLLVPNNDKLVKQPENGEDAAFAFVPEKIYTKGKAPIVWSEGGLTAENNTGHFEVGKETYTVGATTVEFASIDYSMYTGIDDTKSINKDFALEQNYPNPFNPTTTISFNLKKDANVNFVVYNNSGEIVSQISKNFNQGSNSINFDGTKLNSGVYFYKITANGASETKKMVLVK